MCNRSRPEALGRGLAHLEEAEIVYSVKGEKRREKVQLIFLEHESMRKGEIESKRRAAHRVEGPRTAYKPDPRVPWGTLAATSIKHQAPSTNEVGRGPFGSQSHRLFFLVLAHHQISPCLSQPVTCACRHTLFWYSSSPTAPRIKPPSSSVPVNARSIQIAATPLHPSLTVHLSIVGRAFAADTFSPALPIQLSTPFSLLTPLPRTTPWFLLPARNRFDALDIISSAHTSPRLPAVGSRFASTGACSIDDAKNSIVER